MKSASDPLPLAVALSELIAIRGFARVRSEDELQTAWKAVVGEELSEQTRPLRNLKGTLTVAVNNTALLNELVSFQSPGLLSRLNELYPHLKVKTLKFRLNGI